MSFFKIPNSRLGGTAGSPPSAPVVTDAKRPTAAIFLSGLSAKEWSRLYSFGEIRAFSAGEVLVAEGESDDSFSIMTAGSADVLVNGRAIGRIAEGSVFGEVAFFDRLPRSATIRAAEAGSAAIFSRTAFDNLAAWEPVLARRILLELGAALALRLRAAERRATI